MNDERIKEREKELKVSKEDFLNRMEEEKKNKDMKIEKLEVAIWGKHNFNFSGHHYRWFDDVLLKTGFGGSGGYRPIKHRELCDLINNCPSDCPGAEVEKLEDDDDLKERKEIEEGFKIIEKWAKEIEEKEKQRELKKGIR